MIWRSRFGLVKYMQHSTVMILLADSVLWGIGFTAIWYYRSALASRISLDYFDVNMVMSLPLAASSITYIAILIKPYSVIRKRLYLFKLSAAVSRITYLMTSLLIFLEIFSGKTLVYIASLGLSIASGIGSIAGLLWTDYISDNISSDFKSKFIALDTIMATIGMLIGNTFTGYLLSQSQGVKQYGLVYTIASAFLLMGVPLLLKLKDSVNSTAHYSFEKSGSSLYKNLVMFLTTAALLYFALNIPSSIYTPYMMKMWNANEVWLAFMYTGSIIANLLTPWMWRHIVDSVGSLNAAKISIAISIISTAIFPYLRKLELQVIRSTISSIGGVGLWITFLGYIVIDVQRDRVRYAASLYLVQNLVPAIAMSIGAYIAETLYPEIAFYLSAIGLLSIVFIDFMKKVGKNMMLLV